MLSKNGHSLSAIVRHLAMDYFNLSKYLNNPRNHIRIENNQLIPNCLHIHLPQLRSNFSGNTNHPNGG
jgi:hypothetical protein